ncbi:MAG: glycosyltransferase family 2 protein [Candidatus Hinthialibacter antarcticus]|nr:glycosyltransferase family 2 protein [Candidatus Hinthialibacter antarcticus]
MSIYILLPAYNEALNIRPLLESIDREFEEWSKRIGIDEGVDVFPIVVDDGSSDGTTQQAQSYQGNLPVTVITHEKNQGLAAALQTGLLHILGRCNDDDVIVTLDADGTHPARTIYSLADCVHNGAEIAVASRYAKGGVERGVSLIRKILSRGARLTYHLFRPDIPLKDFSCGFRGFKARILRRTVEEWGERLFESPGFTCTGELMLKALPYAKRDAIVEIPFELQYDKKEGESKMPAFKTTIGTITLLMRARTWARVDSRN